METELTKQDILELFDKQSKSFDERLKKSQLDFDKWLGQLAGTWGKFVTEMVKPKIVELFKEKGIEIETIVQSVERH